MRANRRNVLIGLGTIVAGGGAALGTGAFSSVEATRDVDIDTAGDDAALIRFDVSGDLAGGDADQIELDLDGDVNENAVTRFDDVLTITNHRENEEDKVDIEIQDANEASNTYITSNAGDDGGFQFEVISGGDYDSVDDNEVKQLDGAGGKVEFNVVFGYQDTSSPSDIPENGITIIANSA
ncbi:hypothetical protein [Natronosalvus amylolyticus]|uniref:hypothetical protein n=1 Tax=Natronosalvus amylolyticus TaxID=2961994 RepID=UPI0020C979D4|nr:hypothetical protein [Natronosalvus amylolyticus]